MQVAAVAALFSGLDETELVTWIERGWVQPEPDGSTWSFQEIDVARVHLIHDLRRQMGIGDEAIPVLLSLLDQVYELRSRLRAVVRAVDAQPDEVRKAILAAVRR